MRFFAKCDYRVTIGRREAANWKLSQASLALVVTSVATGRLHTRREEHFRTANCPAMRGNQTSEKNAGGVFRSGRRRTSCGVTRWRLRRSISSMARPILSTSSVEGLFSRHVASLSNWSRQLFRSSTYRSFFPSPAFRHNCSTDSMRPLRSSYILSGCENAASIWVVPHVANRPASADAEATRQSRGGHSHQVQLFNLQWLARLPRTVRERPQRRWCHGTRQPLIEQVSIAGTRSDSSGSDKRRSISGLALE
jgi:hypothetical protein